MIYLDNSATTAMRPCVIEAFDTAMRQTWFNPSAAYAQALVSEKALEAARRSVARSLGAGSDGAVVFTGGGTEGDNLAIAGTCYARGKTMRHIVTTAVEHPAVLRTCEYLQSAGFSLRIIPVDETGRVRVQDVADAVQEDTGIVSVMHVNNETGAVNDIAAIAAAVKEKNPHTYVHVDGVQAYLRVPVDLHKTGVDLYSASAHKIHGPKGVGFLFVRRGVRLDGVQLGGGQEMGLRSGTQNVAGIVALQAAVEAWQPEDNARMARMRTRLYEQLAARVPDMRKNGAPDDCSAPHILNVGFAGVRAETLLHALEQRDILVSTGSACSSRHRRVSPVLEAMGVPEPYLGGSIRISLGALNCETEVEPTVEAIAQAVETLRRFRAR